MKAEASMAISEKGAEMKAYFHSLLGSLVLKWNCKKVLAKK